MSDDIDALVDWQLAGKPPTCDNHCYRCGTDWHGEPQQCPECGQCCDCGLPLRNLNRMQVCIQDIGVVYVCPKHFLERALRAGC